MRNVFLHVTWYFCTYYREREREINRERKKGNKPKQTIPTRPQKDPPSVLRGGLGNDSYEKEAGNTAHSASERDINVCPFLVRARTRSVRYGPVSFSGVSRTVTARYVRAKLTLTVRLTPSTRGTDQWD